MPRGGLEVALDTQDEPFYGKTPALRAYTCKTRAKAGTSRFFRIASAYVIWREVRLTLALTYVLPEDDLPRWSNTCFSARAGGLARDRALSGQGILFRGDHSAICNARGKQRCWPVPFAGKQAVFAHSVRGVAVSPPTIPSPTARPRDSRWSIPACLTRKPGANSASGGRLCWSISTGHPIRSSPNTVGASALRRLTGCCAKSRC